MNAPESPNVRVEVDGVRGTLTLTNPTKLNPLSTQTLADIESAALWLTTHPGLKVVVVSGEGRSFSAGADVSAFAGAKDDDPRISADVGRRMADAVERIDAVTIARLQGHCVGGGLVVAAACDLRVAAEDIYFSIPEIDLGIPLAWGGIPRLVREIGPALTKELVMTCRPFGAAEAKAAGFLNRVVPAADLDDEVEKLAAQLASKPKLALLSTKRHTNAVTDQMVGTGRSWSDADGLMAGLRDVEGRASAAAYLDRVKNKGK